MKNIIIKIILLVIFIMLILNTNIVKAEAKNRIVQNEETIVSKNLDTGEIEYTTIKCDITPLSINGVEKTEPYNPVKHLENNEEIMPLELIGPDNRVRTMFTDMFPFSAVAYMEVEFPNGTMQATAAICHRNIAITAAHCVYSEELGGWAKSIKLWPGKKGDYEPFGYATVYKQHISTDFMSGNNLNDDWAMLQLSSTIGDYSGWLGLQTYGDYSFLKDKYMRLIGYPSNEQYISIGTFANTSTTNLYYTADTTDGESGSPVFDDESRDYIIGVHSRAGRSEMPGTNICTNITNPIFNFFKSYMN